MKSCPKSPLLFESLFLLGESQYRQKKYEDACSMQQELPPTKTQPT